MVTITTTVAPESREDALMRLATQARATGVKLYQDRADGRFYASSRSQQGVLHRVTAWTCTCPGFVRHGRSGDAARRKPGMTLRPSGGARSVVS